MARYALIIAALASVLLGWPPQAAAQSTAREGLVERVNKAIDAGVRFLAIRNGAPAIGSTSIQQAFPFPAAGRHWPHWPCSTAA